MTFVLHTVLLASSHLLVAGFKFNDEAFAVTLSKENVSRAIDEALANVKYSIEQREPEIFNNG